jgi:NADPH:quinone reductase-like Zn-dependent oxidoreductase
VESAGAGVRAAVYQKYGAPDVLAIGEVARPEPGPDDVLIQVCATSLNAWDWDLLSGLPLNRLMGGLLRPRRKILGSDIAGRVESVGENVTRFRPGDEVFGDTSAAGWGGLADYVCAPQHRLTLKSSKMTFEEAAAIPQAALLALQSLRKADIARGDQVLINGAGGGFGSFAIQLAKHSGAEVTGVDRADKQDFMRSIGADHVIDYADIDYTRSGARYDLIVDAVAQRSLSDYDRALAAAGTMVVVGGSTPTLLQIGLFGSRVGRREGKQFKPLLLRPSTADLDQVAALCDAGHVRPIIDRCFGLEQTADAFRYLGAGNARGKVVVAIAQ